METGHVRVIQHSTITSHESRYLYTYRERSGEGDVVLGLNLVMSLMHFVGHHSSYTLDVNVESTLLVLSSCNASSFKQQRLLRSMMNLTHSLFWTVVVGFCTRTTTGFTIPTRTIASQRQTSSSTLSMVADDAKVILVTGSSRGLGKSIAIDLGSHQQKVVVNYVSEGSKAGAEATVEEIKALGGDAICVQADTSNPEAITKMFDEIVEKFGTCDVLINNAGITRDTLVMRMKADQWQSVIDTNLSGVFYCTQAFFKIASKKRTGRIINMSSVVGQIGNPGQANYAAAKAGVIGLTKANAKEFAIRNITVNAICPGFIESDMTAVLDEEYLKKVSEGIPLKRLGKASEIAGMTRFLALDPAADYITGHTFNVDGGIAIGV